MSFKSLLTLCIVFLLSSCNHAQKQNKNRTLASEKDPWTTWSRGAKGKSQVAGLLVLKGIREQLLENNLHDPHVSYRGYGSKTCTEHNKKYRSADGTCYVLDKPYIGASGVAFSRNIPPEYIDKNGLKNIMSPDPALISKELHTRNEFKEVPFLNMLSASWIQFMNHDWLSHGKNNSKRSYSVGGRTVERTKPNPIASRNYKSNFGQTNQNIVTHWWDGSQLYGSSQKVQNQVRSFNMGKLRLDKRSGKSLLPLDNKLDTRRNKQNFGYEITGFRENWWVGLSMLHLLFAKEHNKIADMLVEKYVGKKKENGKWVWNESKLDKLRLKSKRKHNKYFNDEELDEHIFQVSRLINAAVMAKIHTVEWTPAILKNKTLRTAMYTNWYGLGNAKTIFKGNNLFIKTDYDSRRESDSLVLAGIVGNKTIDSNSPYGITEEFTSVYRLHPLLPESLQIKNRKTKKVIKSIPLTQTRNEKANAIMENSNLEDLFYSFGVQKPGQLVLNNFPSFMQNLTIPGFGKMDLAAVDILRDRERGVPRYNQFRRAIGLKPISSYRDFFPANKKLTQEQKTLMAKLEKIYGKGQKGIEKIDLMVGAFAEDVRPDGFGFGETQFQIFILMASRRLMADRFFTVDYNEQTYTKEGLKWIDREGWMHKVITRHLPNLKRNIKNNKTAFYPWRP